MSEEKFFARTKSFTRRARELSPALEQKFAEVSSRYVIEVPRGIGETTVAPGHQLDAPAVFQNDAPLIVEVGSGRGEQIVAFASQHPQLNFLAFEVWVPGIARLTVAAAEARLRNLRVIEADAQQALPILLPASSIRELWSFFPDPWRKTRHHKRRLVSESFAQTAANLLEEGGVWRMATDWENYAHHMLEVINSNPDFALADEDEDGEPTFSPRFPGRVETHFERRGIEAGRGMWDLAAVRLPRQVGSADA